MRTSTTIANNRTLLLQCSPSRLPQLFIRVRHHSSTKLFVAGLSYNTNETVLRDTFEPHGEIIEVKVICDHKTGESKEYGFVRFHSETAAATARKELHGKWTEDAYEWVMRTKGDYQVCQTIHNTPGAYNKFKLYFKNLILFS